ncbi:MAG TPA: cytochrome c [Candidatus Angelobacter sp.]
MLAAVFALAGCRQDMHNQPKFIPLRSNDFFADQRSERNPIRGTVPRLDNATLDMEQLDPESYYLSGKRGVVYGNELPLPLTRAVMDRGQERYNIYCSPCHARVGDGNGMIVQRGFKHPPSFHDPRLRNAPLGYFYEVISNGFGAMPDYAAQIKPADRWAITAYVRALQLSQNASEGDLTAGERQLNPAQNGIVIPRTSMPSPRAIQPNRQTGPEPVRGNQPETGGIKR